jgi:hypothetical protein
VIDLERRKNRRWKLKPGVILEYRRNRKIIPLPGRFHVFGTVADISLGGLGVEYQDREMRPMRNLEYALSVPDAGVRIEGLPLFAVSDFLAVDKTGCEVCRRRGLRFGSLSDLQRGQLQSLIERHAEKSPDE